MKKQIFNAEIRPLEMRTVIPLKIRDMQRIATWEYSHVGLFPNFVDLEQPLLRIWRVNTATVEYLADSEKLEEIIIKSETYES
jgi:hypothetical protein